MKAAMAARAGSSPLARGLPAREELEMTSVRIIPARAGFTRLSQWSHEVPPDHPRSRGVYYLWTDAGQFGAGSSPLARGLQEPSRRARAPGRIIPARAGFTSPTQPNPTSGPDHPRSRGVYTLIPRERGCARIIPARAGFTNPENRAAAGRTDHPRSRGVYKLLIPLPVRAEGSSPLARGLHLARPADDLLHRIIPARAGFTVRRLGSAGDGVGSSPLARGLRRAGCAGARP